MNSQTCVLCVENQNNHEMKINGQPHGNIGKSRIPWNKGLTKETDPRVKAVSDILKTIWIGQDEEKKETSKKFKKYWATQEAKKVRLVSANRCIERNKLNNPMKYNETKNKQSISYKKYWADPIWREKQIRAIKEGKANKIKNGTFQTK